MKVLKLKLEGFTCYNRPTEIDFSDLELFAITGPTGAGKSSLVDAIVFALYGKVPRLSSDIYAIISQNAKRMNVLLEFVTGNKKYKVARRLQSSRGNQAILDEFKGGIWQGVCSGVRSVNSKISAILGLDYEAFTRCIVLPQGAFEQFLQDSKSRQDILVKLLGLEILGKIQKKASKKHDQCKGEIARIERSLKEEFGGINSENIQKLKNTYLELTNFIDTSEKELDSLLKKYEQNKKILEMMYTVKNLEGEYDKVVPGKKKVEELKERIDRAKKIIPIVPQLEMYKSLIKEQDRLDNRDSLLSTKKQEQEVSCKIACEMLSLAEKRYKTLGDIDARYEELQKAKQLIIRQKDQEESLQKQDKIYKEEVKREKGIVKKVLETEKSLEFAKTEKEKLSKKLQEITIKKRVLDKFHGAQTLVNVLKETRSAYTRSADIFKQSSQLRDEKNQHFQKLLENHKKQEGKVKKLQENLQQAGNRQVLEKQIMELEQATQLQERLNYHITEQKQENLKKDEDEKTKNSIEEKLSQSKDNMKGMKTRFTKLHNEYEAKEELFRESNAIMAPYLQLKEQLSTLNASQRNLSREKKIKEQEIDEINVSKAKEQERLEKIETELVEKKNLWTTTYTEDLALSIRKHVKQGDQCPVCKQKVKKLPQDEANLGEIKKIEDEIEEKAKQIKKVEQIITDYKIKIATLQEADENIGLQIEEENLKLEKLKPQIEECQNKLLELLESEHYEEKLSKLWQDIEKLTKDKEQLRSYILDEETFIFEQETLLKSIMRREQERRTTIEKHQKEITELREKIANLSGGVDIREQQRKNKLKLNKLNTIEKDLAISEKNFTEITLKKEVAYQQYLESERTVERCQKESNMCLNAWKQKQEIVRDQLGLEVENIEQALLEGLRQHDGVSKEIEEISKTKESLEKDINRDEIILEKSKSSLEELKQSLKIKKQFLSNMKKEIKDLKSNIQTITQGENIEQLLVNLRKERQEIESSYMKAREENLLAEKELENITREVEQVANSLKEILPKIETLKEQFHVTLSDLGVKTIDELIALEVPQEDIDKWENEILQIQWKIEQIENKLKQCKEELAGKSTSPETIHEIEKEMYARKKILSLKREEKGSLSKEIEQKEKVLKKLHTFEAKLKVLYKEEKINRQLTSDLRANNFQSYVLEEALRALLEDGSFQFDILSSGRYAFTSKKRNIYVVDHWNNDEMRHSKTLSGGETFLASLSLALALSDRIYQLGHKIGGGSALESLFLDEGFGSLDEEHLEVVVKSLGNLQGTGRTIGIISHLPILNNYLPARLVIKKERDGSTIKKESN